MNFSGNVIKKKYTSGKPGKVLDAEYFYYDTAPDYKKELAIVAGGFEKCAPDYEINRSNYPYYFIKYTIRGKGILEIDSQQVPLRPGILTGFEPGTAHHFIADPKDPMEHFFITFLGTQAHDLFRKSKLHEKHFIEAPDQKEMLSIFQKIVNLGLQKPEHSLEICINYLQILMLEQTSSVRQINTTNTISMNTYSQCKRIIDLNFSTIHSPNQVARECGIDVRYMASLFKKYCHIPPSQYIMRLKLNKAANLLLTTDSRIKEISYLVGFDSPYHFSKNFKKFHGLSPDHYRDKHMQQAQNNKDSLMNIDH